MVWWIRVLELAGEDGKGTGKYRLTATSDEDGGGPYGLCPHEHETIDEAQECLEAKEEGQKYG